MVLTLDQNGVYGEKRWQNADEANAALSSQTRNFLKRLRRYCVSRGWVDFRSQWVATVEAHRTGWPHMNFVIHCPELAAELAADAERKRAAGASQRNATLLDGDLLTLAMATGWGPQSTAERANSADALAGYITKLAGAAGETMGELAKLSQSPTAARKGFRRLRAGVGFLPPKRKNEAYTGTLIRRLPDASRTAYAAVPLVELRDPMARHISTLLLPVEEDCMHREFLWKLPPAFGEERKPIPRVQHFVFNGSGYELASVAPLGNGEVAPLGVGRAETDATRPRLVLPTHERPPPDAPAPNPVQVQRVEYVQLGLVYGEPIFELRRVHAHVHAEALSRVDESG